MEVERQGFANAFNSDGWAILGQHFQHFLHPREPFDDSTVNFTNSVHQTLSCSVY